MNQTYEEEGAQSIIESNVVSKDLDGTYFRTITTEAEQLLYTTNKTNLYQLVVKFPEGYSSEEFQDILEMIEITVDGKQIID